MAERDEIDAVLERHEKLRQQHRVMTQAEYAAWCRHGDAISHPSSGNPFPGGLTITMGPPYIGRLAPTRPGEPNGR